MINANTKIRIAIASGKGGTGKTLVATNIFYSLIKKGVRVALVDCDAEQPNSMIFFNGKINSINNVSLKTPVINADKCTFCGQCYEYCNYNAIFYLPDVKKINVLDDLCHSCGACVLACKHNAITEIEKNVGSISQYHIENDCMIFSSSMIP